MKILAIYVSHNLPKTLYIAAEQFTLKVSDINRVPFAFLSQS